MKAVWAAAVTLLAVSVVKAGGFNYADFSSTAGLQLNGDASASGGILTVVSANMYRRGSVFRTTDVFVGEFTTTFRFRFVDLIGGGADGLTFTIQPTGPGELGGSGGGLGYAGISPSVAVEFDIYYNFPLFDPSANHIGVNTNGSVVSVATTNIPAGYLLQDGQTWTATIDYAGGTLTTRLYRGSTLVTTLAHAVDIPALLGTSYAYVGFTASTGGAAAAHQVLSWSFQPAPEPTSLLLMAGGAGLVLWRRRRNVDAR